MERMFRGLEQGNRKMQRIIRILYGVGFFIVFLFLLWKCRYGFADADETFFLSVPYRLLQGDRLLIHESHLAQFGLMTIVPEMWLYLKIAGSTTGIFLTFRYVYTVLWSAGSLFLYFKARKLNEYGAMCASLFMQVYAPFSIMAFSYNSLGILYLINADLFLLCASKHVRVQFVISGLFFAGAVLCCPYLALVYLGYSVVLWIARLRGKHPRIAISGADAATCWTYFTLGVVILGVFMVGILFANGTPAQLWEGLTWALQDPEHSDFSWLENTREYFQRIGNSNAFFYPMLITVILMTILSLYRQRAVWFAIVCCAVIFYLRQFLKEYGYPNFLMFPLSFAGIYVLIVTRNPEIRSIGKFWLIPGLLYTYCLNYSSNQFFYAISSAATVSSTASLIMMWMYSQELRQVQNSTQSGRIRYSYLLAYIAVVISFGFQMKYEIPIRYQTVYWEPGLMKYEIQQQITDGPEKGIIATQEKAENYIKLCQDISKINNQRVCYLSEQIWMYLVNDNRIASYSAWLWRVNDWSLNRLMEYYAMHPEQKPDVIFMEAEYEPLLHYLDVFEYSLERLESGNYLIRLS